MLFLRGEGVNSETVGMLNGLNPLEIDMDTNNAVFGGSITSGGGTVTTFTGVHVVTSEEDIYREEYKGYIVSSTSKYRGINSPYHKDNIKYNINIKDSLPIVELSKESNDKRVFGVISEIEDKFRGEGKGYDSRESSEYGLTVLTNRGNYDRRLKVNGCGEGGIWVSDYNGVLENGDYITSSVIPGIGMRQSDDILRSYTVAKITTSCDFEPKMIPVKVLLSNNMREEKYFNSDYKSYSINQREYNDSQETIVKEGAILDELGKEIYVDLKDNEGNIVYNYEYDIKYVDISGREIDRDTYMYNSNMRSRNISSNVVYYSKVGMFSSNISYNSNVEYSSNVEGSSNVVLSSNIEFSRNINYSSNVVYSSNEVYNSVYRIAFVGCTYKCS